MPNIEELREYCLKKLGCTESFPFDEHTLVFKTGNKMFALFSIDSHPLRINLKCDPERAIELREQYNWILPGYHMSKIHWNSVIVNEETDHTLLYELIDDSYQLIYDSLPLKVKKEMKQ